MLSPTPHRTGRRSPSLDTIARPDAGWPRAWLAASGALLLAAVGLSVWGTDAIAPIASAGAAASSLGAAGLAWYARRNRQLADRVAQLEKNNQLRAALLRHPAVAFFATDERGTILEINDAAETLLGYGHGELAGQRAARLFAPEELQHEIGALRRETGLPVLDEAEATRLRLESATDKPDREWRLVRKDGSRFPARVVLAPLHDAHGRYAGAVRTITDISQTLRDHAAAEAQRQRFEEFFEYAPASVAVLDRELRYVAVSRRWLRDYRLDGTPLIGRYHLDIFSTLPRRWRETYRRCLEGAIERGEDDSVVLPDGSEALIRWECRPWRDPSGEIGGIAIFSEILTAKKLEQQLCDSQAMLSAAQALAHVGSWELDPETGKLSWSAEMKRIHGLDTHVSLSFEQAIAFHLPEYRPALVEAFERAQLDGTGWDLEMQIETGDRRRVWVRSIGQTERRGNETVRLFGTVQDISERKHAEQALTTAKDAALRVARDKSDFLSSMSHEIRTPLNAVIGMSSLLLNTSLDSEQREYVSTVRSASDNLLELINDILDFSKAEAGKLELEHQPFSLPSCIESALDLVAPRAAEKNLELACWIDRTVPGILVGDVTRLRQVIVNLLSNAVKFTAHGEVFVSVNAHRVDASLLRVSVRDTGIGIPPDRVGRLFQSFSQVDASTARTHGGTGLGLAISRRLVELMGGRIWVESEPNRGSIFHFEIPLVSGEEAEPAGNERPLAGTRFLVVDDNASAREIVQLHLESWGAAAVALPSAMAALALVRQGETFDAVIVDRSMPVLDGLQFARQLRGMPEGLQLPVVLLSGLGLPSISPEEGSFSGVLTKPLKPHQLLRVLQRIVAAERQPDTILGAEAVTVAPWAATARLLLVEDNSSNQRVGTAVLTRMGFKPDTAADGLEAIQSLDTREYDLVLMDLQMPHLNGLDATAEIRRRFPAVRQPVIVAMTASVLPRDREACLAAGMDDFIMKPIRAEQLQGKIEHGLKLRAARIAELQKRAVG